MEQILSLHAAWYDLSTCQVLAKCLPDRAQVGQRDEGLGIGTPEGQILLAAEHRHPLQALWAIHHRRGAGRGSEELWRVEVGLSKNRHRRKGTEPLRRSVVIAHTWFDTIPEQKKSPWFYSILFIALIFSSIIAAHWALSVTKIVFFIIKWCGISFPLFITFMV